MVRSTRIGVLAATAAVPLTALAISACGGSGSGATAPPTTASGKAATVGLGERGQSRQDPRRLAGPLAVPVPEGRGNKSACAGACAAAWPPLRATGKPVVGTALSASKIGTTARSDGKPQVTYNGHPLYLYSGDQKPGDTNGQGLNLFGGALVRPVCGRKHGLRQGLERRRPWLLSALRRRSLTAAAARRTRAAAYVLGALSLAGEAAVHVQQYASLLHEVRWIGPLFLANAAASVVTSSASPTGGPGRSPHWPVS